MLKSIPPSSSLFPYTTLFRSLDREQGLRRGPLEPPAARDVQRPERPRGARGAHQHGPGRGRELRRATPRCVLRSEEHTSELQSLRHLVCRLLLEKKKDILIKY